MKRSKEVLGVLVFYCSQFGAYLLADRCDAERRIAQGEISRMKRATARRGRRWIEVTAEQRLDLDAVVAQRRACLNCPGVCARSLAELREGKLEL